MGKIIDPNAPPKPKAPLDEPFLVQVNDALLEIEGKQKLFVRLQLATLDKQPLGLPIHLPGEALPLVVKLFQQVIEKYPDHTRSAVQVVGKTDVDQMRTLLQHKPEGEPS